MNLTILYVIFACIATGANIGAQAIAVRVYSGPFSLQLSVLVGTAIGLVVKYALDKRWIFRWQSAGAKHNAQTFLLYTLTGVCTTLIFWLSEFLFQSHFKTEAMRYVGAGIGLAIGYVIKYQLDKSLVFVERPNSSVLQKVILGAGTALLLFTVGKMLAITFASPIIGYANNYDFLRVESCMGLWQDVGGDKTVWHMAGPVNRLVLDRDVRMDACVISIDDLFPYLATRFSKTGQLVDFRKIGGLKAASTLAALCALLLLARRRERCLVVAALFALVFGDFGYLAYINTLYTEFSLLLGLFMCSASLWLLWTDTERPSRLSIATAISGLLFLGLAKHQYSGLATVFATVQAIVIARRWQTYRGAVKLLIVGLACPFVFGLTNPSDYGLARAIKLANITDTYLGEVLTHATDRPAALNALKLPASCERGIGDTWYTPGVPLNHPCPELIDANRIRLIGLFVRQPRTFFVPMADSIKRARPIPDPVYGMFEDPASQYQPTYQVTKATSLTTYMDLVPEPAFRLLMIGSMISGAIAAIWCLIALLRNRRDTAGPSMLLAVGGVTVLYALGSSVFGDGVSDMTRHTLPWCFGLGVQGLALAIWLAKVLLRKQEQSARWEDAAAATRTPT